MSTSLLSVFSTALTALVEKTSPAIVGIEHKRGAGSGFALTPDGYLLTNAHVVQNAQTVRVSLHDGDVIDGRVLGRDVKTDLAVVRINSSAILKHLELVDKRSVQVGQIVLAVGNPFRFERSVSWGVVSALDRTLPAPDTGSLEGLIQTDAAINPGNSGGPLVLIEDAGAENGAGRVVGINTAIVPYGQGLGFAVPSYTAHWIVGELLTKGRVVRRMLGISARSIDLPVRMNPKGHKQRAVYVMAVEKNSAAERDGIKAGDLLLKADELQLWNIDDLQRVLATGETRQVSFGLLRNHKALSLDITLRDAPQAA